MVDRVTLKDIAEASGTSLATVSLALRSKPGVSPRTRERVLTAARKLGYERPSPSGDDAQQVRNIALIFRTPGSGPERAVPALNRFYSSILAGIQQAANEARMNLVLGSIPVDSSNDPIEMPPDRIFENAADGVLLVGAFRQQTVNEVIRLAGVRSTPIVLVDGKSESHTLDCVASRNREGAIEATNYLISRGHRRIAFAARAPINDPNFEDRREGYEEAMASAELPAQVLPVTRNEISLAAYDDRPFPFSGVVCGNDHGALVLMRELRRRGVKVPHDVSIIGFDDTDDARTALPKLTTMAVDMVSMGRAAVSLLQYRMNSPEAAQITMFLKSRLTERDSVQDHEEGEDWNFELGIDQQYGENHHGAESVRTV